MDILRSLHNHDNRESLVDLNSTMEYDTWECRNLARCVLSDVFRRITHHMNQEHATDSVSSDEECPKEYPLTRAKRLLHRERIHRVPKEDSDESIEQVKIPRYRRFARSISVSPSSSSSREDTPSFPAYRRFSRSIRGDDSKEVIWPPSGRMNSVLGRTKIDEFIRKTWRFNPRIRYTVDFKCVVRLRGVDRYKYCTLWTNGYVSSRIYFTVDASAEDDSVPVSMTYSLPDGKRVHRPSSPEEHIKQFLKHLDPFATR